MVAGVWSDDTALQLEATTQFRKLLSIGIFCCLMFSRAVITMMIKFACFNVTFNYRAKPTN